MRPFRHIDAKSVEEASAVLRESKGKARLNAGGTDLIAALKDKIYTEYPETIVNIKTIPGLSYIKEEGSVLKVGAMTTLADIAASPVIKARYALLCDAAESVGSPNLRNTATIGGNLCQDVRCWYFRYPHQVGGRMDCLRKGGGKCFAPAGDNRYHAIIDGGPCFAVAPSDTAVALLALDAKVKAGKGKSERSIPIKDLYSQMGNTLEADEVLTEVLIPLHPGSRQLFQKFRVRKPIDFAIVSVASVIMKEGSVCKDARLALGGVASMPIRATAGEKLIKGRSITEKLADEAAEAAVASAKALSRNAYKIEETKTLVKRAILA